MDPLFEVELDLAPPGSRDASRRLYEALKAAILDGRLAPGARLPPTRRSDSFFRVSRNTLAEVYERLANDGLVEARAGSGVFVAETPPPRPGPREPLPSKPDPRLNPVWLRPDITADMGFWRDGTAAAAAPALVDFRPALVDSRLFPLETFRRLSAKQLRGLERRPAALKSPQGNQGNWRLRDAITRHIALTRAVVCDADDILVTAGAQQGFDLLARVLVKPGETVVAVEDPGYPPLRAAFAAAGARLVPVPVDADGLVVEALPKAVDVVCVCPSHQFPLGVTLSAERRARLVALARERGFVIVEDDYDGEFRFEGGAVEALRTADAADVVVYVGSFSKCMLPALRLGFLAPPPWALKTLVAAKNLMDWHSPIPIQTSVAAFISEGHLSRHVRKMRDLYRRRRTLILDRLARDFAGRLEPLPSFYGLHLSAVARPGVDVEAAAAALQAEGVKLHSLERYYLGAADHTGLVFGYGAADLPELEIGLERLEAVLRR